MRFKKTILKAAAMIPAAFFVFQVQAQTDTMPSLLGDEPVTHDKAQNAFKTSRVINLQSIEVTDAGVLDFKINHRFGEVKTGAYEAFGLDNASVRIGGEYGIIPNLAVIFGRSNIDKMVDLGLKYRFMHQTTDNHRPVSMLVYAGAGRTGGKSPSFTNEGQRLTYVGQLIVGRKFTEGFSAQISPGVVSQSASQFNGGNVSIAVGLGFRQKITPRTSINAEWIPVVSRSDSRSATGFTNSLSVGVDVETGGHVFQLQFTNSIGMSDPYFISRTTGDWLKGGFRFGFNISRVFTVVSPDKFKNNTY